MRISMLENCIEGEAHWNAFSFPIDASNGHSDECGKMVFGVKVKCRWAMVADT